MNSLQSFEQLEVWQKAQDLAVHIYQISKSFPKQEIFGLTNQVRRASYSISANIAEGFGRKTTRDKLQFYRIAYGSLLETKNFLYLAKKLEFISNKELDIFVEEVVIIQKLLNGLMRSTNHS